MIKAPKNILSIKAEIADFYGKEVIVHVDMGRNRTSDYTGRLTGLYPALFTVTPDDKNYRGKTSYSYSEILCVEVKVRAR